MCCDLLLCFGKSFIPIKSSLFFFFLKFSLKNVMEYAFYEVTIGEKWNVFGMGLFSLIFNQLGLSVNIYVLKLRPLQKANLINFTF
jgi:hypothetical protein